MYELLTIKDISKDISNKIKKIRIVQNYTQREFALKAGVTLSTYRTFEKSGQGSFETFIKIIGALGRINELDKMLILETFSPIEAFQQKKKPERQRVKNGNKAYIEKSRTIKDEPNFLDMIRDKNAKN
ncbi:MAG: helix-turn-helix transcriptional regulator [Arcobacteraceae bacterium]|nr:helix-turn-helix transcriptional regulator [Arcobacteraceae bacterium]